MEPSTIERIEAQLRELPPEKLAVVSDFVAYLTELERAGRGLETVFASESVLARDWDRPEEDEAWRDL